MLTLLKNMSLDGLIRPIDYQFARFIGQLHGSHPVLSLCSALVSYQLGQGNVCLSLRSLNTHPLLDGNEDINLTLIEQAGMPIDAWHDHLLQQPAVGDGERPTPLVLENQQLYLYRYWQFENNVAAFINTQQPTPVDIDQANLILDRLFKRNYHFIYQQCQASHDNSHQQQALVKWLDIEHPNQLDWSAIKHCILQAKQPDDLTALDKLIPLRFCLNWQKVAAALAAIQGFTIISGGPGTGKTTTVTQLLALLVELGITDKILPIIQLVAPTGKAAARLTESIGSAIAWLNCDDTVKAAIPTDASTIHRLLDVLPGNKGFRHNKHNKLHLDILVVDEASMIDLPLMSRLLEALPAHTKLILLGDRDQLASVEAGSILGDICDAAAGGYSPVTAHKLDQLTGFPLSNTKTNPNARPINDCICLLEKSYRFDARSGIGSLANAINTQNMKALKRTFASDFNDIALYTTDDNDYQTLIQRCTQGYRTYLSKIKNAHSHRDILDAFQRFQLLCALREGRFGVSGLNQAIEQSLIRAGLISEGSIWYEGRPILITQNDHDLGLYNGDIGIALKNDDDHLRIIFLMPDGAIKTVLPSRLPPHETVYAMTVHKSQGSEFEHAVVVLPDQFNPVLTRELVYTGITRAKKKLDLFCRQSLLIKAIQTPTRRLSGLQNRL